MAGADAGRRDRSTPRGAPTIVFQHPLVAWTLATLRQGGWAPASVFLLDVLNVAVLHGYRRFPWLDIPMHLLGGLAIAYFFHRASLNASRFRLMGPYHAATHAVLVFALVATAAVFWEFAEWLVDWLFHRRHQTGLDDTMLDLLLGIVGGTVFLLGAMLRPGRR